MDRGVIQVYYGEGHGKSTAAIRIAFPIAAVDLPCPSP